jgi:hypothetical protein
MEEQIIAKDALLFVAHGHVIALLAWTSCSSPPISAGANGQQAGLQSLQG